MKKWQALAVTGFLVIILPSLLGMLGLVLYNMSVDSILYNIFFMYSALGKKLYHVAWMMGLSLLFAGLCGIKYYKKKK